MDYSRKKKIPVSRKIIRVVDYDSRWIGEFSGNKIFDAVQENGFLIAACENNLVLRRYFGRIQRRNGPDIQNKWGITVDFKVPSDSTIRMGLVYFQRGYSSQYDLFLGTGDLESKFRE